MKVVLKVLVDEGVISILFLRKVLLPYLRQSLLFLKDTIIRDGTPAHFHSHVRDYLNQKLQERWISRSTPDDRTLIKWPPDQTTCCYFYWQLKLTIEALRSRSRSRYPSRFDYREFLVKSAGPHAIQGKRAKVKTPLTNQAISHLTVLASVTHSG